MDVWIKEFISVLNFYMKLNWVFTQILLLKARKFQKTLSLTENILYHKQKKF